MTIMNVLSLFGGLGLFLFGMQLMGEALEKAAGTRLKKLLGMVTGNRFLAMLAGITITAVVQSSSATTVMVVGFVNAGLMSLTQAVGVIMGANIGTTVTSLLLSVQIDFAAIFTFLGLILSNLPDKYRTAKQFGTITMGLGILFIGMNTMSGAMEPLRTWEGFQKAMASINNPILGVLIGAGITAVLQSSAASIGILQTLVAQGLIGLDSAIFILFGQNIGTCVTALLACAGTNSTAKRAATVHLLFNVIGTVIFVIIACCLPLASWVEMLSPGNLKLQIAIVHILFNVTTTALLLPAASWLEKLACLLIKGDGSTAEEMKLLYFDARMLKTPPIAVAQLFNEVQRMGGIAMGNFQRAMECFNEWDAKKSEELARNEDVLDYLNREITDSLVEVKGLDLSEKDTKLVGSLFHVVNDMERIGDHSQNILESAQLKNQDEVKFSPKAVQELESLSNLVRAQVQRSLDMFKAQVTDNVLLGEVENVFRFTYKQRDYRTLSLSEKILAGIEVAAMMRRITGIDCPICIDNTESIGAFNAVPMPSQTLLLRFTKGRPLTVQAKNNAVPHPVVQELKKAG